MPNSPLITGAASNKPPIVAAGVVTFRPGREVLLVHRPKYDDWSFPKGKLDRWEHATAAAVREVVEETGVEVRLGPPLAEQHYPVNDRPKVVHYWTGRVLGSDDVGGYQPNAEIDGVRWVPAAEAARLLTHTRDRATLAAALEVRHKTRPLVVLRHAEARSRSRWHEDDALRPLLRTGEAHALRLAPMLAAYQPGRLVSSSSTRCLQTLEPFAADREIERDKRLSEEGATAAGVTDVVEELLAAERGAVLCTHRPVLPLVLDALGVKRSRRGKPLAPGEMLVLHLRKGSPVAMERHAVGGL
ncbi:NUDIX domain-containing protein [Nocardioides sp. YIM 152588]|uniref:NUDIX hydrolase n=1 Tax=Nocardioides sp. YIM 152588 TaxID=3158259 RepID=UPI0032E425C3